MLSEAAKILGNFVCHCTRIAGRRLVCDGLRNSLDWAGYLGAFSGRWTHTPSVGVLWLSKSCVDVSVWSRVAKMLRYQSGRTYIYGLIDELVRGFVG